MPLRATDALLQRLSKKRRVAPHAFAVVFAGLDDKEPTLAWLEKAYTARDAALPFPRVNPRLAFLCADRRFQDLVGRMKFPDRIGEAIRMTAGDNAILVACTRKNFRWMC